MDGILAAVNGLTMRRPSQTPQLPSGQRSVYTPNTPLQHRRTARCLNCLLKVLGAAALLLALCCMPDYLILDEPVDGLDPVMRRQVWSLVLADVAQRGTTVLVSSHNLRELEDVCDHVGIMDHGKVLLERSLAQLQDNMVKLQVVFPDGVTEVPADLPVLHASRIGRIHTLIMRMNAQEAEDLLAAYSPLLVDAVPLTLEEIFIYELGGADYAVKDIVL